MQRQIGGLYLVRNFWLQLSLALCLSAFRAFAQSAAGSWDSRFTLPPGLNGRVNAMVTWSNALYVGGWFSKAGGVPTSNIAKWDGTNWTAVGTGISGEVYALAAGSTGIYAGGAFEFAGGVVVSNVAKWNGNEWEPLGAGISGAYDYVGSAIVSALYSDGTNLFVGGQFVSAGGITAYNVARWDGANWNAMDGGAFLPDYPAPWGMVRALTSDGTNIFAGGIFVQAGSVSATNIARWDGNHWYAMGDCTGGAPNVTYQGYQLHGIVYTLTMQQGTLIVGGNFDDAGGIPASGLATWDGSAWHNIGDVSGGTVITLESSNGSLLLAGDFDSAGGIPVTNVASWSNGIWSGLPTPMYGGDDVTSIKHFRDQVYVSGAFGAIDGVSAGSIALWNSTNWCPLGKGIGNSMDQPVYALATDGSNVYAAGLFGTVGTNISIGLAKWDGANWSNVGTPLPSFSINVNAMAVVGSNIFLGGYFNIPGIGQTGFACWDGTQWSAPGGFSNATSFQVVAVGGVVYLSGSYIDASGNQVGPVSVWDGTNLTRVPDYVDYNPVSSGLDESCRL